MKHMQDTIWKAVGVMFVVVFAMELLTGCSRKPVDATTPSDEGVSIHVDRATGCQYVSNAMRNSALTPRLDRDGKPMCGGSR